MYLTVCPPCGPGSIPGRGRVFRGIFSWLITLCQRDRNGSISPRSRHATCGQTMAQSLLDRATPPVGRQWLNLSSIAPRHLWADNGSISPRSRHATCGQTMAQSLLNRATPPVGRQWLNNIVLWFLRCHVRFAGESQQL